jgi:hypothetical protein
LPALALLLPAAALRADEPAPPQAHWRSIVAAFRLDGEGRVHVSERAELDVPPGAATVERQYWTDTEQDVRIDRVVRLAEGGSGVELAHGPMDRVDQLVTPGNGHVVWSVRDRTALPGSPIQATYVIESTVDNALIPAWGLPRGRTTHEQNGLLADPKERGRAILALWREAWRNPQRRYLLDVNYEMPPATPEGTDIQLKLDWDDGWTPVHPIAGDTIAQHSPPDDYNSTRWRVTHLFDYAGTAVPAGVDLQRHRLRATAIFGFPIACLLLWLFFALRELLRAGFHAAGGEEIDEGALAQTLFNEPPEVVAAQWSGKVTASRMEPFLRRLEAQRKVAITVIPAAEDDVDDLGDQASIRLLVPREQLTPYERAGIDALMPPGAWESTSAVARKHQQELGFSAPQLLELLLTGVARAGGGRGKAPWYSKLTSFALFAFALVLLGIELVRHNREPVLFAAALVASSMLTKFWPEDLVRAAIRRSPRWTLLALAPITVAIAAVAFVHAAGEMPAGMYAAAGFSLALFATVKAMLAAAATREGRDARRRHAELLLLRRWLRAQLQSPQPHLRDDAIPWLQALELDRDLARWRRRSRSRTGVGAPSGQGFDSGFSSGWTGTAPKVAIEGWGDSLVA